MFTPRVFAGAALLCFPLIACSSPEEVQASPVAEVCEAGNAHAAFADNIAQVPQWNGHEWALVDSAHFDPCAELSWQTISVEGATASSPHHIMLFHYGEYIGTATAEPYAFFPSVEQVNGSEISVTYHWPQEDDANAAPTVTTEANFRWDAAHNKVVMSGDVPPR